MATIMRDLESLCEMYYPKAHHTVVIRDPKDDMVVDCAVEAKADFIVSGDDHLRSLGTAMGISIISPAEFIRELSQA